MGTCFLQTESPPKGLFLKMTFLFPMRTFPTKMNMEPDKHRTFETKNIFGFHANFPERTHLKFKVDTPNCHTMEIHFPNFMCIVSKNHIMPSYYAIYIMRHIMGFQIQYPP